MSAMFIRGNEGEYKTLADGIEMKTTVHGELTHMTQFRLMKGELPMHEHPNEQTGFLVSGSMILTIGDREFPVKPGDSWSIPSMVRHGAAILENSIAIEVFSPPRRDYLSMKGD